MPPGGFGTTLAHVRLATFRRSSSLAVALDSRQETRPLFNFLSSCVDYASGGAVAKPAQVKVDSNAGSSSTTSWALQGGHPMGRLRRLNANACKVALKGPLGLYHLMIKEAGFHMDLAQGQAVHELAMLFSNLQDSHNHTRGLYLHGPVGCGKTVSMDMFASAVHLALPGVRLCRVHFNSFIETVHSQLRHLSTDAGVENNPLRRTSLTSKQGCCTVEKPFNLGRQDDQGMRRTGNAAGWVLQDRHGMVMPSVERLGAQIAEHLDVLCLDEVSITNLQNVVVFGPLIRTLCERGVLLVLTANKAPEDLYEDGQDRDLHLSPLIHAIRDHCSVYKHESQIDYRKKLPLPHQRKRVFQWCCPENSPQSADFLDSWWLAVAGSEAKKVPVAVGYGRKLPVLQTACQQCARFSFKDLCTYPPVALGAADYSELCNRFHTIFVADIPRLRPESRDAARRWTLFLDNCYESHVRLIVTTAAEGPEDLLDLSDFELEDTNDGQSLREASFAVQRATSRLHEMQSLQYLTACCGACEQERL